MLGSSKMWSRSSNGESPGGSLKGNVDGLFGEGISTSLSIPRKLLLCRSLINSSLLHVVDLGSTPVFLDLSSAVDTIGPPCFDTASFLGFSDFTLSCLPSISLAWWPAAFHVKLPCFLLCVHILRWRNHSHPWERCLSPFITSLYLSSRSMDTTAYRVF